MLKFEPNVPCKETNNYLAKFPPFSMVEKISPLFFPTVSEGVHAVATHIKETILAKEKEGKPCVLGLATGMSPLGVYKELIAMHKKGEVSFRNVVTFNLDEYYPMKKNDLNSYNYYMHYHFFDHVDIPKENINIPDGEISKEQLTAFCANYEEKINKYGGIDVQILGIGRVGHIGFNQPPAPLKSKTRLVYLNKVTRLDASRSFGGLQNVPKSAITMGIETIMKARKIFVMAWSQSKQLIVQRVLEGEYSMDVPATCLHQHPHTTFVMDLPAGELLTRFQRPWTIKGDTEDPVVPRSKFWVIQMVVWLSQKLDKPILRITHDDYEANLMAPLVMEIANGNAEDLNLYVYKKIKKKITRWPLSNQKLTSEQQIEAEQGNMKAPFKEKVLIFSPHPDDDVISMGGTLKTLHDQGHEVHVAYMVSGDNGVMDIEARKYLHFLKDFLGDFMWKKPEIAQHQALIEDEKGIIKDAEKTFSGEGNEELGAKTEFNLAIKRFIRSSEAKVAIDTMGLEAARAHCLNLPFYGTSHTKRKPVGEDDYKIVRELLKELQPTAIYAAGDLSDPHGTHRKCLEIILHLHNEEHAALQKGPADGPKLFPPPEKIFLYRGAWQEWSVAMARIIVPLPPSIVEFKTQSILKHQSQKDGAKFMGNDPREFWQRAKERNRNTAAMLHRLGLSSFEACECFVNLNDLSKYGELD